MGGKWSLAQTGLKARFVLKRFSNVLNRLKVLTFARRVRTFGANENALLSQGVGPGMLSAGEVSE